MEGGRGYREECGREVMCLWGCSGGHQLCAGVGGWQTPRGRRGVCPHTHSSAHTVAGLVQGVSDG
jgi:hypothetical protein